MANGDFEDLSTRTAADKILCQKAFNIANNSKHDGYQQRLPSMIFKFFNKNFW